MKILINATNLTKGGGIQVGLSIIRHFLQIEKHEFIIVTSQAIYKQLTTDESNLLNLHVVSNNNQGLCKLHNLNSLSELEKNHFPDVVITIFGPSFWRPRAKHLVGYAIPHYIYEEESPFFNQLKWVPKLKLKVLKKIQLLMFSSNSDFLYSETEDCSKKISKILGKPCLTIPNTLNQFFLKVIPNKRILTSKLEILCIGANYPHKNFGVLPKVRDALKRYEIDFRIHLTIKREDFNTSFKDKENFINHGVVSIAELAKIYQKGSILLFPTLLECFSATYLEASYFGIPILTSNLSFAKSICGDNAQYFNPTDPKEISDKVYALFNDKNLFNELSTKSRQIYENSLSSEERANILLKYCEEIHTNG